MKLSSHHLGLKVEVIKRKGSWSYGSIIINMQQHWPQLTEQTPAELHDHSTVIPFPIAKQG
jgi:hypothetical protein